MNISRRETAIATTFLLLGALFFRLAPEATAAPVGTWTCYVMDRMPNTDAAASWKWAERYAEGLNEVASHATPGTMLSTFEKQAAVVCVKSADGMGLHTGPTPTVEIARGASIPVPVQGNE